MSDAPDIHVCELGPRDGPQNLGKGRSATRRRQRGHGVRAKPPRAYPKAPNSPPA